MSILKKIVLFLFPCLDEWRRFRYSITNHVSFSEWIKFKTRKDKRIYWPVHQNSEVTHPDRIFVGINSNAGTRPGCYIQGNGGIYIGNYVHFASNIGIISANHDMYEQMKHVNKEVRIGDYCWIGMNALIMPGVTLGERTIVGGGAVVTHSFPQGYCVIAGNPAKVIKQLDRSKYVPTKFSEEFYGYVPKEDFLQFAQKNLSNNIYFKEMEKNS